MPYIVARPGGAWEVRESRSTAAGPRSRTLATFRTLTPAIVERARARSSKPLDPKDLRNAARRAGAPVACDGAERAGAELLAELAAGRAPRPALRRLLLDTLGCERPGTSDSARAAARWVAATPRQRGEALRDLLLLADRLPRTRRPAGARFPRIRSRPA
ncbi:MAG TPA: hypothetical protein VES65_11010 [Solirubrobacteraceae bacterium]|nr:hypothetical protein [Solirubrobacteraceae bacterium]